MNASAKLKTNKKSVTIYTQTSLRGKLLQVIMLALLVLSTIGATKFPILTNQMQYEGSCPIDFSTSGYIDIPALPPLNIDVTHYFIDLHISLPADKIIKQEDGTIHVLSNQSWLPQSDIDHWDVQEPGTDTWNGNIVPENTYRVFVEKRWVFNPFDSRFYDLFISDHPHDLVQLRCWLPSITTGAIGGLVKYSSGQAVNFATVTISNGSLTLTTTTDTSGAYWFPTVPAGPVIIHATKSGDSGQVSATVTASQSQQASVIWLQSGNPPPAPTTPAAQNGIELCDGSNYGAPCRTYTYVNNGTCINLVNDNMDNKVESLRIKGSYVGNYEIILYENNGCGTYTARFGSDATNLGGLNNISSSFRIEQLQPADCSTSPNGVTLYVNAGYEGHCHTFTPGSYSDLSQFGLDQNITSIKNPNGAFAIHFNDGLNFSGTPGHFDNDVHDLGPNGWSDRARSVQIEQHGITTCNLGDSGIIAYTDSNYHPGGGCITLTHDYDYTELSSAGFADRITSLKFVGSYADQYRILLYRDAGFQNLCGWYWQDQSDLLECTDKARSIRIESFTPPTPIPTQPGDVFTGNLAPLAYRDRGGSDAVVDGDLSTEWNGGHPVTLGFSWSQIVNVHHIIVWDRSSIPPNDVNGLNTIALAFSDGTSIQNIDMGSLGPRCVDVTFPAKNVEWVNVIQMDGGGSNGFKEIEIWAATGPQYSSNSCVNKKDLTVNGGWLQPPLATATPGITPTFTPTRTPPATPIPIRPVFGTGADEDFTVSGTKFTDDVRASLTVDAIMNQSTLSISSITGFAIGQEILIIQMQGTETGKFEFATIASVGTNSITVEYPILETYTTTGNDRAQVLRVMNWNDLIVPLGTILTTHAWDGSTGGIMAFRVLGDLQVAGNITVSGLGYQGAPINTIKPGRQGNGELATGIIACGPNGMGGGGGGSNGYGNPPAGGGGGHATVGQAGDAGGGNGGACVGIGGLSQGTPELPRIFMGGGGGSGGSKTNDGPQFIGGAGGNGGGAILLYAHSISVSGSISANGSNGGLGGGGGTGSNGGGGAGGSTFVKTDEATLGTNRVTARKGLGGVYGGGSDQDGGNGADGRIRIEYYQTFEGATDPGASVVTLATPTPVATWTPSRTPTITSTSTITPTPSRTPSPTKTSTQTISPTPSNTPTASATPTATNTPTPAPVVGSGIKGEYYNNKDFTGWVFDRIDPTVSFDWFGGSPAGSMDADTFSVRWTGLVLPQYSETYTFYTISDDGIRLWVNGQLVISNWTDHGTTEDSGTISLTAGQFYDIQIDFYENGGGARAILSWSSASQSREIVPQARLYPQLPPTPTSVVPTGSPTVTPTITVTPTVTQPQTPAPGPGRIVFMSPRDGTVALYQSAPDGTGLLRLTGSNPSTGNFPKYSPDGSKIAFETNSPKYLWVMNYDGSGAIQLSDLPLNHATLTWSPDGSRIFFMSGTDAYTIKPDGTGLTHIPGWLSIYYPSSWSPDGSKILVSTDPSTTGKWQIWTLNPDGTNPIRLSNPAFNDGASQWSPDGSRIAFQSDRSGQYEVWVMNADGSNATQLTTTPNFGQGDGARSIYPRWSPDGSRIVFSSTRYPAGYWDLFVMNADGSNIVNITDSGAAEQWAWWAPYPPVVFTVTPTLSATPTMTATNTATATSTNTPSPTYTATSTFTPTHTPTPTKVPVIVVAHDKSKTYGGTDPAFSFDYIGLTDGDTPGNIDTPPTCEADSPHVNAGSYSISCSSAVDDKYVFTYNQGTLAVNERPITVTADDKSKVYGSADPVLSYQITNGTLVGDDDFIGTLARAAGEDVGNYTIMRGTLTLNSNYDLTFVGTNLAITPKHLTVTADEKSKTYGSSDPALTYQVTGGALESGDSFTGMTARTAGENVGAYAIRQGSLTAGDNYNLTFISADLAITVKPVTVAADEKSKVYGSADPTLTYHVTGGSLEVGDSFSGALTRAAGENVAAYSIIQGSLMAGSNYDLTFVSTDLEITAKPITVQADARSKVYGSADPSLTYQITGGSLESGDSFTGTLTRTAGEGAGIYVITQGTLTAGGNYNLIFNASDLTITPKPVIVAADARSKVYGSADPALTYQITSGSLVDEDNFSGELTRAAGEDVGSFAITQGTLTAGNNYNLTFVGADLAITARPITVTVDAQSKVYGSVDPSLTYRISSGSLVDGDHFSGALTRTVGAGVGTYVITRGALSAGDNYNLTFIESELTITPKPITVTVDAQSKVYGAADPSLAYQITGGSLESGDSFTGTLTRTAGEGVGIYAITQGTLTAGGNYNLTFNGSDLTIAPKPITVIANAKSKVYGSADPALTYQITSGAVESEDSLSGALTRAVGEDVGTYTIFQGTLTAGGNYTLTYVSADFSITPKFISVTADPKTKTYGENDPVLTYAFSPGLVGSDAFTGNLSRGVGEDVGTVAIMQSILTAGNNYDLAFVGANLTITARPITVTADGKSKVYGSADPSLTHHISSGSLVGDDDFTGALARASGENTGIYAIMQGTLTAGSNYDLTYMGADLVITKADQSIINTIAPASAVNGEVFTVSADSTSGLPVTYSASGACANTAADFTMTGNTGTCTVYYDQAGDGNYNPAPQVTKMVADATAPVVLSSMRANVNPTAAANIDFTVTFSEPVTGVDMTDFDLTTSGSPGASISGVSGSGAIYMVSVNTGSGDGMIRLNVSDDDSVMDGGVNPLGGMGAGNGSFSMGETYTVKKPSTVNLAAPVLRSPQSNLVILDTTPTFLWRTVRGAQTYEVVIATDSAFTNMVSGAIVTGSTSTLLSPLTDGQYYWRVRAYNVGAQPGQWSSSRTFTIDTTGPSTPILNSPSDNASTGMPTFRWLTVPDAVSYQLQYDNDADFSSPKYNATLRGTSRRPPAMPVGTYYWRVRAKDAAGNWGAWSAPFTINITSP